MKLNYLIGEIMLTAIGILIALQINNLNQSKQDPFQSHYIILYKGVSLSSEWKYGTQQQIFPDHFAQWIVSKILKSKSN